MCCCVDRKTVPRVTTNAPATNVNRPQISAKPADVKSSFASRGTVQQPSQLPPSRRSPKSTRKEPRTSKPAPLQRTSIQSANSQLLAKPVLSEQPLPASKTSSSSHPQPSTQRRSFTSQFLKSGADRLRTVNPSVALVRGRSACDRRKSYQVELAARQKMAPNQPRSTDSRKSRFSQPNSKKPSVEQSCHDRRKSYQAALVARQTTSLSVVGKPVPRPRSVATVGNVPAMTGPRVSTPSTSKRTSATTPSLSCIPRRKNVSFVTPTSQKATPQLRRTQPVKKEMSLR